MTDLKQMRVLPQETVVKLWQSELNLLYFLPKINIGLMIRCLHV